MHHEIDLPTGWEEWADSIASLQGQLRDAVAASQLLQAQALHFGDGWVENLVKVHVNVTQPPDASFWTAELFPAFTGNRSQPISHAPFRLSFSENKPGDRAVA